MNKYGKTIKKLRLENNLTQKQLGDSLNVSYQAVSKWEKDLSMPDLPTLQKMVEIFGISLDEFIAISEGREFKIDSSKNSIDEYEKNYYLFDEESRKTIFKRKLKRAIITTLIVSVICILAMFEEKFSTDSILGGLSIMYVVFASVYVVSNDDGIINDIFWGSIGFTKSAPGIIFTLDLGSILFAIAYKLIIAPLITIFIMIVVFILGMMLTGLLSIFAFPFALIKDLLTLNKEEEI